MRTSIVLDVAADHRTAVVDAARERARRAGDVDGGDGAVRPPQEAMQAHQIAAVGADDRASIVDVGGKGARGAGDVDALVVARSSRRKPRIVGAASTR
jgi:hypothetical protein